MKRPHEDTGSEIGNVQRKMTVFVKQQAVEEIVSKQATVDGFSINAIKKKNLLKNHCPKKACYYQKTLPML